MRRKPTPPSLSRSGPGPGPNPWTLACALLLALTCSGAATRPSDHLPEGSQACREAATREDAEALRSACLPGREAGNRVDGYNLALGLGPTDPEAAMEHLLWAAAGGLAEAAHLVGNMLLDAGDATEGLAQLEAAAEAGLALAQYDYATALFEHHGPDQRDAILFWYGQAAAGGEESARYNLGVLYLEGLLAPPDPLRAWAWMASLEQLEGHPEVYRLVNRLAREMSRPDRQHAEILLEAIRLNPGKAVIARP